jgi:polyisoprenoid-binding protein YceI
VDFAKDGTYAVTVSGDLTIKDVVKPISAPATIVITGNTLETSAGFSIKLADYGISGAPFEAGKVAKEPKITVSAELK